MEQLTIAEKSLGKSREMYLARAEAYRQGQQFQLAEQQYRAALALKGDDLPTQLALADTLYRLRRYADAIEALNSASKLAPEDPVIYARMAQIYARQHDAPNTARAIEAADKYGKNDPEIQMAAGDALLTLGERDKAMERFSRALEGPSEHRMGVRLAIAQVFVQEQRWDDARRQIGLALSEARVEDALVTPDDLVETANLLLAMHDLETARKYFEKARLAGANGRVIALGMANTYLAQGDTKNAQVQLAGLGSANGDSDDYDYLMAMGNMYQQRRDTVHALSTFARANSVGGHDDPDNFQKQSG